MRIVTRSLAGAIAVLVMGAPLAGGSVVFVDDDASPGGDGTSWDSAYRFLQDALTRAASEDVSEIRVGPGVHRPDRSEASPGGTGARADADDHVLAFGSLEAVDGADPQAMPVDLLDAEGFEYRVLEGVGLGAER